jgi:hypothetical protein
MIAHLEDFLYQRDFLGLPISLPVSTTTSRKIANDNKASPPQVCGT